MLAQGVTIGGIPIPSRHPLFLATVAVHVAAGIVAVVAGAAAMLSEKTFGRHPRYGTLYFRALCVVGVTMGALAIARWPDDNHLAVLGIFALLCAFIGRRARRRQWARWPFIHIPGMGVSYVLMLTAFYVDNGPHLPGWRLLPPVALWIVPAAIGMPVIVYAMRKHRNADDEPRHPEHER